LHVLWSNIRDRVGDRRLRPLVALNRPGRFAGPLERGARKKGTDLSSSPSERNTVEVVFALIVA
jgi:hypothetical protein